MPKCESVAVCNIRVVTGQYEGRTKPRRHVRMALIIHTMFKPRRNEFEYDV